MNRESGEIKTIEVLMKAASFFLAGFFILTIIIPSDLSTLELRGWITLGAGILICLFGFLLAVTAIPVKSQNKLWNEWIRNMNTWATGGSSILFAVVVLQLIRYIFVYKDIEILRVISIVFLVLFGLLFIITLILKSSVFHNIKSNLLFILTMAIFSIIMVLTEEVDRWGLFTLFTIIMLSSLWVWHLEKEREEKERERENK
jgi:hypothetical protein